MGAMSTPKSIISTQSVGLDKGKKLHGTNYTPWSHPSLVHRFLGSSLSCKVAWQVVRISLGTGSPRLQPFSPSIRFLGRLRFFLILWMVVVSIIWGKAQVSFQNIAILGYSCWDRIPHWPPPAAYIGHSASLVDVLDTALSPLVLRHHGPHKSICWHSHLAPDFPYQFPKPLARLLEKSCIPAPPSASVVPSDLEVWSWPEKEVEKTRKNKLVLRKTKIRFSSQPWL